MLKVKLNKILESFGASKYVLPNSKEGFSAKRKELDEGIRETWSILKMTKSNLELKLEVFSNQRFDTGVCSLIEELRLFIAKEKILYHTMNLLKQQNNSFIAQCWIPVEYEER